MSERIILNVNQPAPQFKVSDIFDREIDLKSYRGKKVFIGFFRHAGCPFCNVRVHSLQKHSDRLRDRNLEMIFFFESEQRLLTSNKFHTGISPIPLIADPERTWYDAYGIENSRSKSAISHVTSIFQNVVKAKLRGLPVHMMAGKESINTIPAEFLVDEKGIVKIVHYARRLTDQISMKVIEEFAGSK